MDIDYIREVFELSTLLNYSKTAAKMNISQSALSKHVTAVEQEFGVQIFKRDSRNVQPTRQGMLFLGKAAKLLDCYDEMKSMSKTEEVVSVSGWINNLEVMLKLKSIAETIEESPAIHLSLIYSKQQRAIEMLTKNQLDIYIDYRDSISADDITQIPFVKDKMCVFLRADEACSDNDVSISQLKDKVFLRVGNKSFQSGWNAVKDACSRAGFTPMTETIFMESEAESQLLSIGQGQCFVTAVSCNPAIQLRQRPDLRCHILTDGAFIYSLFVNKTSSKEKVMSILRNHAI